MNLLTWAEKAGVLLLARLKPADWSVPVALLDVIAPAVRARLTRC